MTDQRTTTPPRTSAELLAGGGVVALAASFFFSPVTIEDGPILCPFRLLTGLPCPGCGLTRSWVYASHGWWRESFLAHPFGIFSIAVVLLLAVLVIRARLRGSRGPDLDRWVKHPAVIAIAASWLVFAVVRAVLAA